jgi:isoleucyl-tRNA synthetase
MNKNLSEYQIPKAVTWMKEFTEDLSTWYIRRSRDRVGPSAVDAEDKQKAYTTMYTIFNVFLKAIAPLTPFISEYLYKHLTGEESVHLTEWPEVTTESVIDRNLLSKMVLVRKVSEMGNAERKRLVIAIKQPLHSITVSGEFKDLVQEPELIQLIKEELNVENIIFVETSRSKVEYDLVITEYLKEKGLTRELVRAIQEARKAADCRLDERIDLILPDWPAKFVDEIKRKTLINNLQKGSELQVIRYENNAAK